MDESAQFYTVKELAALLQVNEMTIRRLMQRGELSYHNIGRAKRFSQDDVQEYLRRSRVSAGETSDDRQG